MINLPIDILQLIFDQLPLKSLFHLRGVCQLLRSIIDDPIYTQPRDSRALACPRSSTRVLLYSIHDDGLDFFSMRVGSRKAIHCAKFPIESIAGDPRLFPSVNGYMLPQAVNGLILLKNRVWNPLTGQLISLPLAEEDLPEQRKAYQFMGFDLCKNEYKVLYVRQVRRKNCETSTKCYSTMCKILTLRAGFIGSWRLIERIPPEMQKFKFTKLRGWGGNMLYLSSSNEDISNPAIILALNLHTEEFHTPYVPEKCYPWWYIYNMGEGKLVFLGKNVWLWNDKEGWDQNKNLDCLDLRFLRVGPLGDELIFMNFITHREWEGIKMLRFNLYTGAKRRIALPNIGKFGFGDETYRAICYIQCLIRF